MDWYGHLMEGLTTARPTTSTILPDLRKAQAKPKRSIREEGENAENPLTRGKKWQSRPDSNRRFRLERPGQDEIERNDDQR